MSGGAGRALFAVAAMLARGTSRADRRRRRLMSAATALATFFLLAAVNVILIRGTTASRWAGLVTESGLRPGTALALILLAVPALALLHQAGRVAQATREERLAALRLAGATPRDVRLLSVAEAVRVGAVGAVAGGLGYGCGQRAASALLEVRNPGRYTLPLWSFPVVLVLVVAAAAVVGLLVSRHVVTSPLQVARRASRPRPSPYTVLPLALGVLLMLAASVVPAADGYGALLLFCGAAVTVTGMAMAAGRLVLESARLAGRWARTPETLLAARALEADPRAWGRTMAVVGLVVVFGTGAGTVQGEVVQSSRTVGAPLDQFWVVSLGLTHLALLFALFTGTAALAVHRAESLLESGRSLAVLAATGVPLTSLRGAALRQTLIAATPVCVIAALASLIGMSAGVLAADPSPAMVAWTLGHALLMVVLAVAAAAAVTAVSGRLLARAASPAHLRAH